VEPAGSKFLPDYQPTASVSKSGDPRMKAQWIGHSSGTVTNAGGKPLFREFVAVIDDDNSAVGGTSLNYQTAPFSGRGNPTVKTMAKVVSDYQLNPPDDPPTPVFAAAKGSPVRLRLLHPGGSGNDMTMVLHGHAWQEEPWQAQAGGSLVQGNNPKANWQGSHDRFGPNTTFNLLLGPGKATGGAGGVHGITGDYLLRNFFEGSYVDGGWGILRVGEPDKDVVSIINYPGAPVSKTGARPVVPFTLSGRNTVHLSTGAMGSKVNVTTGNVQLGFAPVDTDGRWSLLVTLPTVPADVTVTSVDGGGSSTVHIPVQMAVPSGAAPTIKPLTSAPGKKPAAAPSAPVQSQQMMRNSPAPAAAGAQ
jgi:hypothetical protein